MSNKPNIEEFTYSRQPKAKTVHLNEYFFSFVLKSDVFVYLNLFAPCSSHRYYNRQSQSLKIVFTKLQTFQVIVTIGGNFSFFDNRSI